LQFVHLFCNQSKCILLFFSCISFLIVLPHYAVHTVDDKGCHKRRWFQVVFRVVPMYSHLATTSSRQISLVSTDLRLSWRIHQPAAVCRRQMEWNSHHAAGPNFSSDENCPGTADVIQFRSPVIFRWSKKGRPLTL
jgi:hypothetical protein